MRETTCALGFGRGVCALFPRVALQLPDMNKWAAVAAAALLLVALFTAAWIYAPDPLADQAKTVPVSPVCDFALKQLAQRGLGPRENGVETVTLCQSRNEWLSAAARHLGGDEVDHDVMLNEICTDPDVPPARPCD